MPPSTHQIKHKKNKRKLFLKQMLLEVQKDFKNKLLQKERKNDINQNQFTNLFRNFFLKILNSKYCFLFFLQPILALGLSINLVCPCSTESWAITLILCWSHFIKIVSKARTSINKFNKTEVTFA